MRASGGRANESQTVSATPLVRLCYTASKSTKPCPTGNPQSMSEREIDQVLVERAQAGDKKAFTVGRQIPAQTDDCFRALFATTARSKTWRRKRSSCFTVRCLRFAAKARFTPAVPHWYQYAKNYLVAKGRRADVDRLRRRRGRTFEDADQLHDINT